MDDHDGIRFSQDHVIRRPRTRGIFPVSEEQWLRLRRMVQRLEAPRRTFQNLSAASASLGFSSGIAAIAFLDSPPSRDWVLPSTIALCVLGLVLTVVFFTVDRQLATDLRSSRRLILEEMEIVEKGFVDPETGEARRAAGAAFPEEHQVTDPSILTPGTHVVHPTFGSGTVASVSGFGQDLKVVVEFDKLGRKKLLARYAGLTPAPDSEPT